VTKERRRFEAVEKVKIIREHLLEGKPLSEVCEKYGIAPTQFYQWQKMFFENGAIAFEPKKASREYELENKVKQLDKKLAKKDEVIAELAEHNIQLKKNSGLGQTMRGQSLMYATRWLIMCGDGRTRRRLERVL